MDANEHEKVFWNAEAMLPLVSNREWTRMNTKKLFGVRKTCFPNFWMLKLTSALHIGCFWDAKSMLPQFFGY